MNGRCNFDFLSMHCDSGGPVTFLLFALFVVCVLLCIVFACLIDWRLWKHHPKEHAAIRLGVLIAHQGYAWRDRGRGLDDSSLIKLLDRYRLVQIAAYGLLALMAVSAYLGL